MRFWCPAISLQVPPKAVGSRRSYEGSNGAFPPNRERCRTGSRGKLVDSEKFMGICVFDGAKARGDDRENAGEERDELL
ncbi:hypothetical protein AAC387_Pa11g1034 [Persea americana]